MYRKLLFIKNNLNYVIFKLNIKPHIHNIRSAFYMALTLACFLFIIIVVIKNKNKYKK